MCYTKLILCISIFSVARVPCVTTLNTLMCDLHIQCVQGMVQIGQLVLFTAICTAENRNVEVFNTILINDRKLKFNTNLEGILTTLQTQDVLYLYDFIKTAQLVPEPRTGWGYDVDPADMSFGGIIERIRQKRNKYVHNPPNAFVKSDLENQWIEDLQMFKHVDEYFKNKTSFHDQALQLAQQKGISTLKYYIFISVNSK